MREKPYIVSKDRDMTGKEFYYCHMRNFPNVPVFGSIGNKSLANKICKEMNKSKGF